MTTQSLPDGKPTVTDLDRLLAGPMFAITILFLVVLAVDIHMNESNFWILHDHRVLWLLVILYPLYPLEALAHWFRQSKGLKQNLLFCLIPIARLGARDHVTQGHIWLPLIGWQVVTRSLSHRLMRYFSVPMIVIALLVIPVIVFELFFGEMLQARRGLKLAVEATSGFIWACFVVEFILVVSVVENRWRYCRQNWINIAVIVLPVIAFAFLRVVRLGRLFAFNQLVRTTRVFRLRGIIFRAWRAIVTLDVIDKILRREPSVRLERTKGLVAEKLDEIDVLRQEIARLESIIAAKEASERGTAGDQGTASAPIATNPPTETE